VNIGTNLDGLPARESVIVVDDAHRRDDLSTLLALARQRALRTKLILACRPHAVDRIRSIVIQSRFDLRELIVADELKELSKTDVTELARQSLSPERQHFAEQLAAATWDCPLITVIAGRLLSEKSLDPRLLERNEEFRDAVLSKFYEEIVGNIGDALEPILCQSLLRVIAALSPLNTADETILETLAKFLGIDGSSVVESLGILERAEILLCRGNTLRITPDVLADIFFTAHAKRLKALRRDTLKKSLEHLGLFVRERSCGTWPNSNGGLVRPTGTYKPCLQNLKMLTKSMVMRSLSFCRIRPSERLKLLLG